MRRSICLEGDISNTESNVALALFRVKGGGALRKERMVAMRKLKTAAGRVRGVVSSASMSCLLVSPLLWSGCAIMMSAKLPIARPPQNLVQGMTMQEVDRAYGFPIAAGTFENGHVEQLQFVDGVPIGWKVARFCIHTALDCCTYCIWELVGTPLEMANRDFKTYVYFVIYDADDKVVRTVDAASPEGRRLAALPWAVPRNENLKVNLVRDVRNNVLAHNIPKTEIPDPGDVSAIAKHVPEKASGDSTRPLPVSAVDLKYAIQNFRRTSNEGYAYSFKIVFNEKDNVDIATMQRIKREVVKVVEEDYRVAVGITATENVHVDFPEFTVANGVVEGRATVMTVSVTSLKYDERTQKGVIAVKIGGNRFENARKWLRDNIETIARDKNIALRTGELPPNKKFFLGTERVLEGNVLEIEFEVE